MTPQAMMLHARETNFDRVAGVAFCAELAALLRRDWAVRVLDAWNAQGPSFAEPFQTFRDFDGKGEPTGAWVCHARLVSEIYSGPTADAARLAAARAIYGNLPKATQHELGVCP